MNEKLSPEKACEHGMVGECEQCVDEQALADEQATDDDWDEENE